MDIARRQLYAMTLAILAVALAACGTATPMPDFNKFAHTVTDNVVVLYWNCSRPAPGVVQVAGVANNPYSPVAIQDLEFRVYGVSAQGGNVSRGRGSAQSYMIYTNEPSPFTIDLKNVGGEARYDMTYSYMLPVAGRIEIVTGGERQNYAQNICAGLGP